VQSEKAQNGRMLHLNAYFIQNHFLLLFHYKGRPLILTNTIAISLKQTFVGTKIGSFGGSRSNFLAACILSKLN
jgi:hypothetical protein